MEVLDDICRSTVEDKFPDSEEAVQVLVDQQEAIVEKLDQHRSSVLSLLQKGKDLSRDSKCPEFLNDSVQALENAWNDTYAR